MFPLVSNKDANKSTRYHFFPVTSTKNNDGQWAQENDVSIYAGRCLNWYRNSRGQFVNMHQRP